MSTVRRRSRGRRNRGRRRGNSFHVGDEFLTFSVKLGATQNIQLGNISTRPAKTNFRILWARAEAIMAYRPGLANDALAGYYVPSALDIQLLDPGTNTVATSRPRVLGMSPRQVYCHYPTSGDWYSYQATTSKAIATINAVCLGNVRTGGGDAYVRGTLHIRYQFSYEVLTATCPAVHLADTDPGSKDESDDASDFSLA